jgi:hypothetical protein
MLLLLAPVFCFSQNKCGISFQAGAGYLFYPGSSTDVQIETSKSNHPLSSGLSFEFVADKRVNSFLDLGLGSSYNQFTNLKGPYVPVFADIRVTSQGKYKLFSFLDPGYGIYQRYEPYLGSAIRNANPEYDRITGGFYIGYGFGVEYKMIYLQAKYNWVRFKTKFAGGENSVSNAYGVAGITFGIRFP